MNIVFTLFAACLYFVLVSPVKMHYLYADNPGTGFVSLNNGGHNYPIGFAGKQRRYMGNSNSQIYQKTSNERTTVSKSPTMESTVNDRNYRTPANLKVTEPPKRLQTKEENFMHDPRNHRNLRGKSSPNQNYRTVSNAKNKEYKSQTKQYDQNYNANKANVYDNKGNILQVNVHKTQIPAEPQKVKLNNNRQLTALSVQRREDNYKRMPTSMLVDKTLQKGANFKERNAQMMSRILDDMTKKVTDRRIKSNEYRKRDTISSYDKNSNAKRNIISDNMKKYIGKDIDMMSLSSQKDAARIGSHEEDIEETNAPYALFYRMSPESLDNQEGFYLMKSMENDGEKVFSIKEKRLSVNYENEVDLKKTKTKKNFNTVKLRKKVKNFASFRNNNI